MAAAEVTISGVLYDKVNRTQQQVVLIGDASLTGVGVGGGPIQPPAGGGGNPPGIWGGGNVPMPTPPIANVPGAPGYQPPGIWGPNDPRPQPPIELPPPGSKPPEPITPPVDWKAIWTPSEGWVVVGIPNVPHPAPAEAPKK